MVNVKRLYIFLNSQPKYNFIIIIDMSSGSLISSLFRDNSFSSRSSSMFHKSFSALQNDPNKNRSQSSFRDKLTPSTGNNKYLPVARMIHSLAVKVKKHNYFLFCRLQALMKKARAEIPVPQLKSIQSQIIECSKVSALTAHTKSIDSQDRIAKGLQSICQIVQLNELKHHNVKRIQYAFRKLNKFSRKKQASKQLLDRLIKKQKSNMSHTFKSIQKYQKFILRSEIFTDACLHVLVPKLKSKMKAIRQYAIERKIKIEIEEREKQRLIQLSLKAKQQTCQNSSISSYENVQRLRSIQQQNSATMSEEETARYVTPEKGHFYDDFSIAKNQSKGSHQESSGFKTSRKETRYPPQLNRRETKKQHELRQQEGDVQYPYAVTSNVKRHIDQNQDRAKAIGYKFSTKKQQHRQKIQIGKAYKVQTTLEGHKVIKMPKMFHNQQKQQMGKNNRLHAESSAQPLPDLHDNMGVFEQVWAGELNINAQDCVFSHRTIQKQKNQCIFTQNQKTIGHSKQRTTQEVSKQMICSRTQGHSLNTSNNNTQILKDHFNSRLTPTNQQFRDNQNPTVGCSRTISNSKSSPKFVVETGINTSNCITSSLCNLNSMNDQFYSSPLFKIEEMMLDLEKLRQRERFNSKYTTGYQKCKISVNLPTRKSSVCAGKSYQGSANKANHSGAGKTAALNECRSDKKEFRKDPMSKMMHKENNQPKENIEVKLWDEKDKFLFYTDSKSKFNKERKRSSCIITSMNQSQINTARKMKKQIEGIINSRKNRTSLGNLKIVKSKY